MTATETLVFKGIAVIQMPDQKSSESPPALPPPTAKTLRRITHGVANVGEALASLVFPPVCVLCGETTTLSHSTPQSSNPAVHSGRRYTTFCGSCETSIHQSEAMMSSACERCGWPRGRMLRSRTDLVSDLRDDLPRQEVEIRSGVSESEPLPCPHCASMKAAYAFERVVALYRYQDAVRDAVVAAKYPRNTAVIQELAGRLTQAIRTQFPEYRATDISDPDQRILVTNVPTPFWRQVRRNGSGTQLLAQNVARTLKLTYLPLLTTNRSMKKQAWLDDEERIANVRGAFRPRQSLRTRLAGLRFSSRNQPNPDSTSLGRASIQGAEIVLVDDVMTTGATANEISRVLHAQGAKRVTLAVVARAIRDK